MPTYQYRCTNCGQDLEAVQKFTDAPLTTCPSCQGTLRKVFSPVGIVFKGSGFYATDNRTKGGHNAAAPAASSDSSTGSSTSDKPVSKPQATDSSKPSSTGSGDAA